MEDGDIIVTLDYFKARCFDGISQIIYSNKYETEDEIKAYIDAIYACVGYIESIKG